MTWLPKKKLHQSLRVKERHGIHDPPPTQNNFSTDVTVILDLPQITRNNLLSRQIPRIHPFRLPLTRMSQPLRNGWSFLSRHRMPTFLLNTMFDNCPYNFLFCVSVIRFSNRCFSSKQSLFELVHIPPPTSFWLDGTPPITNMPMNCFFRGHTNMHRSRCCAETLCTCMSKILARKAGQDQLPYFGSCPAGQEKPEHNARRFWLGEFEFVFFCFYKLLERNIFSA